jgi:chemotaxis protein MotB
MEKGAAQPIIIKKKKGHGHGHHGGSWKVALADFMTAMMAFFLLMWLLGGTTEEEKRAISHYFQDPGSPYIVGEGGADLGLINQDRPLQQTEAETPTDDTASSQQEVIETEGEATEDQIKREIERIESDQLEDLKAQLETEINQLDSVLNQVKDQILIDFTALGLRIQIVDKDQRPMFDVGSANLKSYSKEVLQTLAPILDKVKNKISVTGHTDATPYGAGATYTNWELSADRANSARRALLGGAYPEGKVATVQGMGSVAPLVIDQPFDPINRRIAIIVLKKAVADALGSGDTGINSEKLIRSSDGKLTPQPVQPTRQKPQPTPKFLSPVEIDDAIDATETP